MLVAQIRSALPRLYGNERNMDCDRCSDNIYCVGVAAGVDVALRGSAGIWGTRKRPSTSTRRSPRHDMRRRSR